MATTPLQKDNDDSEETSPSTARRALAQATLPQWIGIMSLIFGGCCSNVFSLEEIIHDEPNMGLTITFFQFVGVALEGLPWHFSFSSREFFLKKRTIPLFRWIIIVTLFFVTSTLNNAALGYSVSIPVYIIFRSGGTLVTMTMGWLLVGKRYSPRQVLAVGVLTAGVILATWSNAHNQKKADAELFNIGVLILFTSQVLSSFMGLYLESTYSRYGSNWREGLFYTHFLGLPFFIPFLPRIIRDFRTMSNTPNLTIPHVLSEFFPFPVTIPRHLFFLFINVITQYLCVRGVNRLTAISTALSIAIILNIRKFVSLALSVAVFGNKLATGVKIGALLVAVGAAWYAWEGRGRSHKRNRSNNIGLLSKPMEMPVLSTQVVQKESVVTPAIVATDLSSGNGSMVATPIAELVDRKELGELHSGNSVKEHDGKPRRRSITEGTG